MSKTAAAPGRLYVSILAAVFSAVLSVQAAPPDLTAGGVPDSTRTQNLGATGMRGWVYSVQHVEDPTDESRQIQVQIVDEGSPAAGIMATNDVIIGADGTGATPVLFTSDARKSLAYAIQDAEANDPAELKLLVWRGAGVTNVETITLQTMGAYSATAPYSCPKSEKILEQGLDYFYTNEDSGRQSFGLLTLLTSTNSDHLARAETEALALIPSAEEMTNMLAGVRDAGAKAGWNKGYALLAQTEYYLATGDTNVLPSIEARAVEIARNQSMFGTIGHKFSDKNADGSDNGSMSGYGPINTPGSVCFLSLLLARDCGVTNAYVQPGIDRASRFFAHYANGAQIPYGEHESSRPKSYRGSNGKNAVVALAFSLQTNRLSECRYFGKMCTAASSGRESGHTGPCFEYFWAPLGAAVAGEAAAASHFSRINWHLDLQRRWDGSFAYDNLGSDGTEGNGARYGEFSTTAGILLTYALPRRSLHITGSNETTNQVLDSAEVADAERSASYDPTSLTIEELIDDLGKSLPQTSRAAATELGTRTDATNYVDQLIAIAQDTGTNVNLRAGACDALRNIDDSRGLPVIASLLTDSENYIRRTAAESLRWMTGRETQVDTILAAVGAIARPLEPFDEEDPIHFDEMKMSQLLFYNGGAYGVGGILKSDISGVDTNLLYPAIEACAYTPSGFGRNMVKTSYSLFTLDDLRVLAATVVDSVQIVAPADRMFSHGIREEGIEVLEKYGIAEGVPLCPIFIDDNPSAAFVRSSLLALENYAGACLNVEPDAGIEDYLLGLIGGPPPYPVGIYATEASSALSAITNDAAPYVPEPFKSIASISADANPITLDPAPVGTTLRVVGHDYAEGDSIYTWRKVHGASTVTFTPNGTAVSSNTVVSFDTPGLHLFEVTMSDSRGLTEVTTQLMVTVYNDLGVLPSNDPPTADPQAVLVTQDTDLPITLVANDPEGYALIFDFPTPPAHGTILGTGSNIVYRPDPYYTGPDSFTFSVTDSEAQSDTAGVTVSVRATSYNGLRGELGLLNLDNANGGINPSTGLAWAPGDEYRLVCATYAGTDALSTNIADYNVFVQSEVSGFGLGGTWKIIGSTAGVDARDNTMTNPNTNGVGVGIFLLDGVTKVADSNSDLWDGTIDAAINLDITRSLATNWATTITGTGTDGTGYGTGEPGDRVLGSTNDPATAATGEPGEVDGQWIADYHRLCYKYYRVYALSDPLQIVSDDTNAPSLLSVEPVNGATAVALDANLAATFSEAILLGSGSITISNLTEGTATAISMTNTAALNVSNDTLTINPPADFERGDLYAVLIPWGAITDASRNSFAGILDTATWSFTTTNPLPQALFAPTSASYPESMGTATGTVVLTHDYNAPVTVEHVLATPAGTATAGDDYSYVSDTLTFNPGETNKSFTFTVIDDTEDEPEETIIFAFGTIGNATAGVVSNFTYTIEWDVSDVPTYALTVNYGTGDGVYTAGTDVAISEGPPPQPGDHFTGWTTTDGGAFADAGAPSTLYTMPANAATVTAEYATNGIPVADAGTNQTLYLSGTVLWAPTNTSVWAWWDPSDPANYETNDFSGRVSTLYDLSGGGKHMTQTATNSQPTAGTRMIGDQYALAYERDNAQCLKRSGLQGLGTNGNFAIFAVHDYDNSQFGGMVNMQDDIYFQADKLDPYGKRTPKPPVSTITYTGGPYTNPAIFNANFHFDSSTNLPLSYVNAWVNGAQEGSNLVYISQVDTNHTMQLTFMSANNASYTVDGALGEVIIIEDVSEEVRQKMEGYLAHKWGLAANLPADHPYKAAAPGEDYVVADLAGSASDPDNDPLTTSWSLVSGPAGVSFGDAAATNTTATFNQVGTYTLRLTADDGWDQGTNDVVITVNPPPTYTVTYDANGSTGGTAPVDSSSPYDDGAIVTVLGNTGTIVRTGYTFSDWNTASNGSGVAYSPDATFAIQSNVTLFAQWSAVDYALTYDGNGSTVGVIPVDTNSPYHSADSVTVLGNTGNLARVGYTYAGWNTASNGTGPAYAADDLLSMPASNVTLYAQWSAIDYTVTYDGNGNDSGAAPVDTNSYNYGETVTVLNNTGNLAKVGFTFACWNDQADGLGIDYVCDTTFAMPPSNVTLFAKYATGYTLAVVNGAGDGEYTAGTEVGIAADPAQPGTLFSSWTTADGGSFADAGAASTTYTMPSNSAMVTALYTTNAVPAVAFEIASTSCTESTGSVSVTVLLANTYYASVNVEHRLATPAGSAALGQDYSYTPDTLIFNPGETSKSFIFTVTDDALDETDETIDFELGAISNGVAGTPSTATYTILSDTNDWYGLPFYEPFENLTLGDLSGQHGWVANDAVVQEAITYGGSAKAGAITNEGGSLSHTFGDGQTKVWTDMRVQVVHSPGLPVPPSDKTVYIYVSTNSQVMAFDGTNAVAVGRTVAEGQWVQVTVSSDYTTSTWKLYLDGVPSGRYGFFNASVDSYGELLIEGESTYVDDLSITLEAPHLKEITTVILVR